MEERTTATATNPGDPHAVLAALNERLDEVVVRAGELAWSGGTPAEGWDVVTQIAHLTWTDEVSLAALTDPTRFRGIVAKADGAVSALVDRGAAEIAATGREQVLARWRRARGELGRVLASADPGARVPWFGPPMRPMSMVTARIMETWAHGTDIADAVGTSLGAPEALPHVARLGVRTRAFAYSVHGLEPPDAEVMVELTDASGVLHRFGPDDAGQRVSGSLTDFCLLVTRRIHRADTDLLAVGDEAERWLGLAQAFAGPPGSGRPEGSRR